MWARTDLWEPRVETPGATRPESSLRWLANLLRCAFSKRVTALLKLPSIAIGTIHWAALTAPPRLSHSGLYSRDFRPLIDIDFGSGH